MTKVHNGTTQLGAITSLNIKVINKNKTKVYKIIALRKRQQTTAYKMINI